MKAKLENDTIFSTFQGPFCSANGLRADGIDPVEARSAFAFDLEKHACYTEDGREVPSMFHLRRTDDDSVVPTRGLGAEFNPVQHHEVYDFIVNDIMPKIPSMKLETVGTIHGGATGMVMATLGDDFAISGDKSPNRQRLFFFNPNGKSSLVIGMTTVRLFCQNQVKAAVSSASSNGFRVWHTTNAAVNLDHALKTIAEEVNAIKLLKEREEAIARIPVTDADVKRIVDKIFPLAALEEGSKGYTRMVNQRNEVYRQFTEGETAQEMTGEKTGWTLFNSITREVFNPRSVGKTTDVAQITYSATDGSRADRVNRIFDTVERELAA